MANEKDIDKLADMPKQTAEEALDKAPAKVSAKISAKAEKLSKKNAEKLSKPVKEKTKRAPKKPVSFGAAAFMSILAAIAGGVIGGLGPRLIDPANAAPADAIARTQASLKQISVNVSAQTDTLTAVQNDLAGANNTLGNLSRLTGRIGALERSEMQRASIDIAAERAQALTPLTEKLNVMEALMQTEDMPEGAPSALLTRLDDLQAQIEGLKLASLALQETPIISYKQGGSVDTPVTDSESLVQEMASEIANNASYDLVSNFPRAEMLVALTAQTQNAEDPSWLRKLFEKHVDVRDTDSLNVSAIILDAERMTQAGNIDGAINAIETLNPTLRAAAHSWLLEAKKTL